MTSGGFSFAAWRAYCAERVRPQHAHDRAQLERLKHLLRPDTASAWKKLAGDVTHKWPAHLEPLTWQGALHQVIGHIVFPPSMIPKTPDNTKHGPFMPAHNAGKNAQRNWVALYLKTWVIPGFFNAKHYEEIATLVGIAWGGDDGFSADQVRLLRPFHRRRPKRKGG